MPSSNAHRGTSPPTRSRYQLPPTPHQAQHGLTFDQGRSDDDQAVWNARGVLRIGSDDRCGGHTKITSSNKGRKCRTMLAYDMARHADEMLDDLATREPHPVDKALRRTLSELADFLLCWRHKEQAKELVGLWAQKIKRSFGDITKNEEEDEYGDESAEESYDESDDESDDESEYGNESEDEEEGESQAGARDVEYWISGLLEALQLTPHHRRH